MSGGEAGGREVHGLAGLEAIRSQLDALHEATGTPVTARFQWLAAWARCWPEWEPWLVCVGTGDRLDAVAPLARRRVGPITRIVGLGHGPSDELRIPARDTDAAAALADALVASLAALRGPWTLLVEQLPVECPVTARLLDALPHARTLPGQGMPRVVVPADAEIGRFLSRNARQAENKARNRLAKGGHEVRQRWTGDADELAAELPRMSAVHRARDEQLGRVSDHGDPAREVFYREVFVEHARAGEADVLLLEIDGDLAAYVGAFRDGRALRVWDNRVSPRWADYSAGRLANHEAIRRVVLGEDYDVLDWMRGEESYKLSSATETVPTLYLEAWSSPAARLPYRAKEALRVARDRWAPLDRAAVRAKQTVRRTFGRIDSYSE